MPVWSIDVGDLAWMTIAVVVWAVAIALFAYVLMKAGGRRRGA